MVIEKLFFVIAFAKVQLLLDILVWWWLKKRIPSKIRVVIQLFCIL